MGKAHALAYAAMPMFFWPAPAEPVSAVSSTRRRSSPRKRSSATASAKARATGGRSSNAPRHRRRRHRDAERQPSRTLRCCRRRRQAHHLRKAARAQRPTRRALCAMRPLIRPASSTWSPSTTAARRRSRWRPLHPGGPDRPHPELPRHLSAGLVGRPGRPALLALPEEDCRLRRGRRYRHARCRHGPLSCRRNRCG